MKQITFFAAILILAFLAFSGCNKNDDNNNPSGTSGSMALKVDGTSWTATSIVQGTKVDDIINVVGSDELGNQATVSLQGISQTGTYAVGPGNPSNKLSWAEGTSADDIYQAYGQTGSGSVTVTLLTGIKIEGTFQFTGYNMNQDSKTITEGSFSANY